MSLSPWTLDRADSREIYRLLQRLDTRQRLDYLQWCCRQVRGGVQGVQVTSHSGTVRECFEDVRHLAAVFGVDMDVLARELVRRVRKL